MIKPKVGIFGLTGCAGDQLALLNCEDRLLEILGSMEVQDFPMASSERNKDCTLDFAFVDGSILTDRDVLSIRKIRRRSKLLIALGTCAVWGGIPATDRSFDRKHMLKDIYGEIAFQHRPLPARPLHEVVEVDLNISGCPIEEEQLLSAMADLLNDNLPVFTDSAVCMECKIREANCLLVEKGQLCLGPVTAGGCKARCLSVGSPCIGCRGPLGGANWQSALKMFGDLDVQETDLALKLRTFAPVILPCFNRRENREAENSY